jgi:hypothetical protein
MVGMATTRPENVTAQPWGWASIANSLLLPAAAAAQLNVTFWVLVMTNFVLMHAVWITQLVRFRNWGKVNFGLAKWPLIAFGVLGNLALLLWAERLLAVFPT